MIEEKKKKNVLREREMESIIKIESDRGRQKEVMSFERVRAAGYEETLAQERGVNGQTAG